MRKNQESFCFYFVFVYHVFIEFFCAFVVVHLCLCISVVFVYLICFYVKLGVCVV